VTRRLFNFVTAVSLLLCVAVAALWIVSYRGEPLRAERATSQGEWVEIVNHAGAFKLFSGSTWPRLGDARWGETYAEEYIIARRHGTLWARWNSELGMSGTEYVEAIEIRHWPIVLTAALLPAIRLAGIARRGRRVSRGRCQLCGYDLTGNVSGVCPECGGAHRADPSR
jgi:hypothetical protein